MMRNMLREIPQISKILLHFQNRYPKEYVIRAAQEVTERFRKEIKEGKRKDVADILFAVEEKIKELQKTSLRRVINATGIVINTNLGRSPLAFEVAEFVGEIAVGYSNLEYDLNTGSRGKREKHVEEYLQELTGAEASLVVNNNAAAVFLILNTLAKGKEVIVSRGELVEIGGSFRIPDIMESAGAILREVGTTNRTHLSDYTQALSESTALIVKVHRSNFYMEGFTQEVELEELAKLAKKHGIPFYYDCGSGLLLDIEDLGLSAKEINFTKALKAGSDIVSGSGDKLLGGPQAGIVLGKEEIIKKLRRNPIMRIIRADKMTIAALEMTLRLYREKRYEAIPVLKMLTQEEKTLKRKAYKLRRKLKKIPSLKVSVVKDTAKPGGGSLPDLELPTYCVAVKVNSMSAEELSKRLRNAEPPVIGRIKKETLLLDTRTLFEEDIEKIPDILRKLLSP